MSNAQAGTALAERTVDTLSSPRVQDQLMDALERELALDVGTGAGFTDTAPSSFSDLAPSSFSDFAPSSFSDITGPSSFSDIVAPGMFSEAGAPSGHGSR